MPSEHIKEIQVFENVSMAFTTSATPNEKTTLFVDRSGPNNAGRGGFRIFTPQATDDIWIYYVNYPDGDTVPFQILPPGSGTTWDNIVSRDGVARGYMGEVQVSSPSASQPITIVEYKPNSK